MREPGRLTGDQELTIAAFVLCWILPAAFALAIFTIWATENVPR